MQTTDHPLITKLKKTPLDFTINDAKALTLYLEANPAERLLIRKTAIEVLDLAPEGIYRSTANDGLMGFLNRQSRAKRQNRFWNEIARNFRQNPAHITVLADGDSWFEHPFLQDIIDHLNRRDNVAVFSLASGGDWLDNILYQGQYVDMLSVIKPDVFLVSGGGNDLLGEKKLGIFARGLQTNRHEPKVQAANTYIYVPELPEKYAMRADDDIRAGARYLTREFFGFINILQWQYYFLFHSIRRKYQTMPILTQGYDFTLPDSTIKKSFFSLPYWYQHYLNEIQKSGQWLEAALRDAEIYDTQIMQQILRALVHIFNEMLIETGAAFDHVYHVDSRGLATSADWFDEIHLKSNKYLRVANTYYTAIEAALAHRTETVANPRIFRSKDDKTPIAFGPQFRAFWRGYSATQAPWIFYTLLTLLALVGLMLYELSPSLLPHFLYILIIALLLFCVLPFLWKLLKAVVLSWHYTSTK